MITLGGSSFVWNGNDQDYCYKETVWCLAELCDQVVIAAGGTDGTLDDLINYIAEQPWRFKVKVIEITEQMWNEQHGREKLSYFSNLAISQLETKWNFYLQCDEIIHERCFEDIRLAIERDMVVDSYLCRRYNLWRDPLSHLVVPQRRKPCSDAVIRLAKTECRCFGDAESLMAAFTHVWGEIDRIEIYHLGYIRDPIKNVVKSKNMLVNIFGLEMDKRIGDKFDHKKFPFDGDDIQPVPLPLPKFIKQWCRERHPEVVIK